MREIEREREVGGERGRANLNNYPLSAPWYTSDPGVNQLFYLCQRKGKELDNRHGGARKMETVVRLQRAAFTHLCVDIKKKRNTQLPHTSVYNSHSIAKSSRFMCH